MLILALDLGKFKSVACVLDTETNKHWFQTMETTPEGLGQFLRETFSELMVIEACSLAGWVRELVNLPDQESTLARKIDPTNKPVSIA